MVDEILKFTKITLLVQLIYGILFAILYWLPAVTLPLFGIAVNDGTSALIQFLGCALAALSVSTILSLRKTSWAEVQIKMATEIVWQCTLIVFAIYYLPIIGVSLVGSIVMLISDIILTVLAFLQQEDIIKPLTK